MLRIIPKCNPGNHNGSDKEIQIHRMMYIILWERKTAMSDQTIMVKPRILVTGATGKTGSVVVAELLKAGYPVRAMVHREDGRSARLKAQGAEIAFADMSDVERVADALKDVQRAYYCPPFDPYMIQGAAAFAVAAKEARLEHIVGMTQWLGGPFHSPL